MTTRQLTAHYHRSQQQEPAPVLVLVGGDGQDARAIHVHGSSRSATVHPSAFVLNGPRLVVVATLGWRNGPLLSTRSDDDDDDNEAYPSSIALYTFIHRYAGLFVPLRASKNRPDPFP